MYARIGRATAPVLYTKEDVKDITIGKGFVVRDGADVSIIACGTMVDQAVEAAERLSRSRVSTRVVDMHTIKPLDEATVLKCAKETNVIVTIEEHSVIGGLGGAVSEVLAEHRSRVAFKRMGVQDMFCESGEPEDLFEKYGLNASYLVNTIKQLIK
jgi:transketolase